MGDRSLAWCQRSLLAAVIALMAGASVPAQVEAQSGERALTIYNIHTKETVTAVFKRNGRYVEAGVGKLNHIMRDHRRNEATQMDPELFDVLWQVHTELGSTAPIHLISGYRSSATNEMLRRTVGGQASKSRHIMGKAADVHFPDIALKQLRYSALIQERGGVGYYPTSALPFVHLDTDRVRSWPRLPRHELALLFPSGSTQHAPASGGPITREDVRLAKARHGELAQQIAMFLGHRQQGGAPLAVADAGRRTRTDASTSPQRVAALPRRIEPAAPSLVEQPQQADRRALMPASLHASLAPSFGDREHLAALMRLAANAPQLVSGPAPARRPQAQHLPSLTGSSLPAPPAEGGRQAPALEHQVASLGPAPIPQSTLSDAGRFDWAGWIAAPAYDDEHPEELSYRPFPIAPYLTDTADQPVMGEFVAPDLARTLETFDQLDGAPTLGFRPVPALATFMQAQQFTGQAIKLNAMAPRAPAGTWASEGRVLMTSQR